MGSLLSPSMSLTPKRAVWEWLPQGFETKPVSRVWIFFTAHYFSSIWYYLGKDIPLLDQKKKKIHKQRLGLESSLKSKSPGTTEAEWAVILWQSRREELGGDLTLILMQPRTSPQFRSLSNDRAGLAQKISMDPFSTTILLFLSITFSATE